MTPEQKQQAYARYNELTGTRTSRYRRIADELGEPIEAVEKALLKAFSTEKAGRPLRPGEGFLGCVLLGDTHTTYFPTIDHMHADHQTKLGLSGRPEQIKAARWDEAHRRAA